MRHILLVAALITGLFGSVMLAGSTSAQERGPAAPEHADNVAQPKKDAHAADGHGDAHAADAHGHGETTVGEYFANMVDHTQDHKFMDWHARATSHNTAPLELTNHRFMLLVTAGIVLLLFLMLSVQYRANPVVPRGKARIRTQMSAALTDDDLELALAAYARVKARIL